VVDRKLLETTDLPAKARSKNGLVPVWIWTLAVAVLLDFRLVGELVIGEESDHVVTLVALKLEDLSHVFVLDDRAVATMRLLHSLQDLLEIQLVVEALHGSDAFAAVALLHADVDEVSPSLLLRLLFLFSIATN